MKKLLALGLIALVGACSSAPKETYPYGMTEKEWNELSVKDKANIRRDFYFYEKGTINFVNPQLEVEGKKETTSVDFGGGTSALAAGRLKDIIDALQDHFLIT